ncbi:hypothetical protein [Virgibacillus sp. SK37]|uniref:hypothetical protein n=1 Tax=Virgibacillus sp. SK37 TaxID=403957 RepID=UPI0004D0DFB7|nr:hypothetical protein [Virgibacillus sp. SK37]AIF45606.1 hypothetical protein X953_17265 [Virgibacillus sp. SK37]
MNYIIVKTLFMEKHGVFVEIENNFPGNNDNYLQHVNENFLSYTVTCDCFLKQVFPYLYLLPQFKEVDKLIDFRFSGTLSTGMASAASSATLRAGSSAHAIPVGVTPFRSNQFVSALNHE